MIDIVKYIFNKNLVRWVRKKVNQSKKTDFFGNFRININCSGQSIILFMVKGNFLQNLIVMYCIIIFSFKDIYPGKNYKAKWK